MYSLATSHPSYTLKLSAISMGFSLAVTKLLAYDKVMRAEQKADEAYWTELSEAYSECEDDLYSEQLNNISLEVDELLAALEANDE